MIKRSELKKDMYVRMRDTLDDEEFWSRLMKGRYFQVDTPATEPDDAVCWSMTFGTIINYGMNYVKQASNTEFEPISVEEQERLQYIFSHKEEFRDLFKLGKKINRHMDNIEELMDEIGAYQFNIWEVSDSDHFLEGVQEQIYINDSDADIEDIREELIELKEMFDELIEMLDKLTALEDKYVRQVDSGVKPDGQESAADSN